MEIVDALNKLKYKVTKEFDSLLCKVRKGHKPNYEFVLEEISLIELIDNNEIENNLTALQYYLNNKWQVIQF